MQEVIFKQFKDGFRYNTTSVLLFDFANNIIANSRKINKVLEVGCGCGFVGILLKKNHPKITLTMLDILRQNCELTLLNLKENKILANVVNADFARLFENKKLGQKSVNLKDKNAKNFEKNSRNLENLDFLGNENTKNSRILNENSQSNTNAKNLQSETNALKAQKFDIIVSNPPFYKSGISQSANAHKNFAKSSSVLTLRAFIKNANSLLSPRGRVIFCYEVAALGEICTLLREFKLNFSTLQCVHKDKNSSAKLVLIEAKKGSKCDLNILSPLFIHKKSQKKLAKNSAQNSQNLNKNSAKNSQNLGDKNAKNSQNSPQLTAKMQEIYGKIQVKSLDL